MSQKWGHSSFPAGLLPETGILIFFPDPPEKMSVPISGNIEIGVAGATRVEAPVNVSRG